jgi:hypothetical protein
MSLMSNIAKFAQSPQGKKLARQAKQIANDPKTKQRIESFRQDVAERRKPKG